MEEGAPYPPSVSSRLRSAKDLILMCRQSTRVIYDATYLLPVFAENCRACGWPGYDSRQKSKLTISNLPITDLSTYDHLLCDYTGIPVYLYRYLYLSGFLAYYNREGGLPSAVQRKRGQQDLRCFIKSRNYYYIEETTHLYLK